MRTHSTRSPQSRFLMASTTLARAASFSSGATESSRSRNVMSAGMVGPLARKRSLDPGTERHERRGSSLVRADIQRSYEDGPERGQAEPAQPNPVLMRAGMTPSSAISQVRRGGEFGGGELLGD